MRMKRRLSAALCAALFLACALPGRATELSPAPSALPEVVDTPLLYEGPVSAAPAVDQSWFDDALFLGEARLQAMTASTGVGTTLSFPDLNVQNVRTKNGFTDAGLTLSQALKDNAYGKIYLMLGLNESVWMDEDTFYSEYAGLIDDLRALAPQARIYIQTLIPVTSYRSAAQSPGNALLARRNYLLSQLAREKQVCLVDTAAPFTQPGGLSTELSTDGLFLTEQGYEIWLSYLRTHTVGT